MTEKINKEELSLLKHTKSLLEGAKFWILLQCLMLLLIRSVAMPSTSCFVTLLIKTTMPKCLWIHPWLAKKAYSDKPLVYPQFDLQENWRKERGYLNNLPRKKAKQLPMKQLILLMQTMRVMNKADNFLAKIIM